MSTFHTQILTPTGVAFEGESESVKIPGTQGNFEVRRNHASLISLMEIGIARINKTGGDELKFAISGGFTEIHDNTVIIMAEAAEEQSKIDIDRAKRAKERAEEEMENASKDVKMRKAEMDLKRAVNRIKVSQL